MKVTFFHLSPIASHFSRSRHARCDREKEREGEREREKLHQHVTLSELKVLIYAPRGRCEALLSPSDGESLGDIEEHETLQSDFLLR